MKALLPLLCILGALLLAGCTRHHVHLTVVGPVDRHITHVVRRVEVNSIFDEIDAETEALANDEEAPKKK